jgi:hypothetical protein
MVPPPFQALTTTRGAAGTTAIGSTFFLLQESGQPLACLAVGTSVLVTLPLQELQTREGDGEHVRFSLAGGGYLDVVCQNVPSNPFVLCVNEGGVFQLQADGGRTIQVFTTAGGGGGGL